MHEFARAKVGAGELLGADSEAINLFLNNYAPDDSSPITQALMGLKPNADDAHSLAFSLIDLAERYRAAELAPALLWSYENTPCANCCHKALVQLDALGKLNYDLLRECLFDSEVDIRAFAQAHQPSA